MPQLIKPDSNEDCNENWLPIHPHSSNLMDDISPYDQPSPEVWVACHLHGNPYPYRPQYTFFKTSVVNLLNADPPFKTWPERKNPFTQSNFLNNSKELFELIQMFKETQFVSYRESLANRLINLFHDAKEEDPLSVGINTDSLRYFYMFLKSNTKLKHPIITLTPELDIYLTWKEGKKRLISIHFLPNGDAHLVVFMPNKINPELTERFYGKTTYDLLIENVERFGLNDLISE